MSEELYVRLRTIVKMHAEVLAARGAAVKAKNEAERVDREYADYRHRNIPGISDKKVYMIDGVPYRFDQWGNPTKMELG